MNFQFINDRLRFAISIFTWRQCMELAINLLDDFKYNVSLELNSEGTQSVVTVDCLVFGVYLISSTRNIVLAASVLLFFYYTQKNVKF